MKTWNGTTVEWVIAENAHRVLRQDGAGGAMLARVMPSGAKPGQWFWFTIEQPGVRQASGFSASPEEGALATERALGVDG